MGMWGASLQQWRGQVLPWRRVKVFLPPPGSSQGATSSTLPETCPCLALAAAPINSPPSPPPLQQAGPHPPFSTGTFLFFYTLCLWGLSYLCDFRHCLYSSSYTSVMASLDNTFGASICTAHGVPLAAQHPKTSSGVQLQGHSLCIWAGCQAAVGNPARQELSSVFRLPFLIPT